MSHREHSYSITLRWTGNRGEGTATYRGYGRTHEITAPSKPVIPGSSDPAFRGEPERYNPEDLLVASLSACHMLSYLHLCADSKIVVTDYVDDASGTMVENPETGGQFKEVILRPRVTVKPGADLALAQHLHVGAHHGCFIANSVNFPVRCEPTVVEEQ